MHKIYYFSGTGNTLKLARDFGTGLGNAELIAISDLDRSEEVIMTPADTIGIFFPVYCFGIPHIVKKFLKRIPDSSVSDDVYLYAVCCSCGVKGAAPAMIEDILAMKKIRMSAAFHIRMPFNYIPLGHPPGEARIAKIYAKAAKKTTKAIENIKARKRTRPLRIFPIDTIGKFIAVRAVAYLEKYDRYFWTDNKCTGCGSCTRLCPNGNISMNNESRPEWHGHCEQCMSCIQYCPYESIQFREKSRSVKRYHHPEISRFDIEGKRVLTDDGINK